MSSSFLQDFAKLDEAVANADVPALKSIAHRLKSSLALAGENEFAKWMEILECNSETELEGKTVSDAYRNITAERDNLLRRINKQIEDLKK
jgi:HPt (histidine-containing phosphotransfer) domain-containing protein